MSFRQAIVVPMVKPSEMALEPFLQAVKEIGFSAIEIWDRRDDFDQTLQLCKELDLSLCSMVGHRAALNDPAAHAKVADELRTSIDIAAEHGIPNLICLSGNRREKQSDEAAIEIVVAALVGAASLAERRGVNLNLELLNSRVDHHGYQCDRTKWGVEVCERVKSLHVKLLFDIYHMQIMEGDIIRTLRDNIEWIGHFHTAGVPGRQDLDDEQELNYRGIAKAIAATGYSGFVGHEFKPKADVVAAMKQAYEICQS
jgi:hydroxypyruvate isomerase